MVGNDGFFKSSLNQLLYVLTMHIKIKKKKIHSALLCHLKYLLPVILNSFAGSPSSRSLVFSGADISSVPLGWQNAVRIAFPGRLAVFHLFHCSGNRPSCNGLTYLRTGKLLIQVSEHIFILKE